MSVRAWFRERLPVDGDKLAEMTNEPVPNHMKKWWFALGGTPAYLFVVQIVTGILLAFYYEPSPRTAYQSVHYITHDATYGWFLRGMHKWAATLMIAAVILHQMRVYFTAAYQRPRELNWIVGMGLLVTVLITGFTGYSLVYEQLSYWGATVGANIAEGVPFIGGAIKRMMLGGEVYGERTLSRFFVLHAAVLPAIIGLLVIVHIIIIRMHGVTELRFKDDPVKPGHFSFFPDHMYTELILGLSLMILLCVLATVLPAELGPRADPHSTPEVIKPEWFFYVAFRWLKLFSRTTAILSMGAIVLLMFLWPFIDSMIHRKTKVEVHVYIGIAAVACLLGLTVWEAAVAH